MRRSLIVLAVAALAAGTSTAASAAKSTGGTGSTNGVALPNSIASTGDSITRAYDATSNGCFLADCPQYSWSTGTSSSVSSEYRRILAKNNAISGHVSNDAKTGAKMVDLDGQLLTAAGQGVQYATVLMGANDVCTSTIAGMTPTATVQAQFQQALTDFTTKDPGAHVFVSSIPNVYQLWSLLHTKASGTWQSFGICQSMLASANTEAQRQQVVAQETADNNELAAVCARYLSCRWDGYATYNTVFTTTDVSTVDYFHPSISGQKKLAGIAWAAGPYGP